MNKFWMFIHNAIAHPLMAFGFNSFWTIQFHDWTAAKAQPSFNYHTWESADTWVFDNIETDFEGLPIVSLQDVYNAFWAGQIHGGKWISIDTPPDENEYPVWGLIDTGGGIWECHTPEYLIDHLECVAWCKYDGLPSPEDYKWKPGNVSKN